MEMNMKILTPEERALLMTLSEKMGIEIEEKPERKKAPERKLDSYFIRYDIRCSTCGQVQRDFRLMEPLATQPATLMGKAVLPLSYPHAEWKVIEKSRWACSQCSENLMKLEKEELIAIILKQRRQ